MCFDQGVPAGPARRILAPKSRALVLVGLFVLTLSAIGSVSLMVDGNVKVDGDRPVKRQFQLGALFAHQVARQDDAGECLTDASSRQPF